MSNLRGWVKRLAKNAGENEYPLTMPDGQKYEDWLKSTGRD